MASTIYLRTFFKEKGLSARLYEVEDQNGDVHLIWTEMVLDHIFAAGEAEQDQIAGILRRIDFHNGDVHHFLAHLATGLAHNFVSRERSDSSPS